MKSAALFFIKNYKLTIILSLFLFVYGLLGLKSMNAELFPAVSLATATVVTQYPGASAEDVETKITKPIEDEVKEVIGIKDISSISKSGLSYITIRVDMDNYDVAEVMDEIQKKVDGVTDLPSDLQDKPEFTEINSEELPVYEIALVGSNKNRHRDFIAEELQEHLESIDSVKEVQLKGFGEREYRIILNLEKLKKYYIGINEVITTIQSRNIDIPGGNLKKGKEEALVRVKGTIDKAQDLGNFLIRANFTGQKIYLRDIAKIEDTSEEKRIYTRIDGKKATLITVIKKAGKDSIVMVDRVKKEIEEFKRINPLRDLKIEVYQDSSIKVRQKLEVLASNAVTGLVLVIIFLFIFLPGKIGIAACLSLPLAVMATFGIMPAFGMNLDSISILALIIAIGMLVDNSVVISETYTTKTTQGMKPQDAALESVKELWGAITASALTTISAFLPMLVTKGVMGAFISYIPIVVTASLIFSLVESFFLLPMRLKFIAGNIKQKVDDGTAKGFDRIRGVFESFLAFTVKYRYLMLVFYLGVIFTSFYFIGVKNRFILFPPEETEIYLARYESPNGTTVEETDGLSAKLTKQVYDVLGDKVKFITAISGEQRDSISDPKGGDGANLGLLRIFVTDETKYNISYNEIIQQLNTIQAPYMKDVVFEEVINGPPVGSPIEGKLSSNNNDNLNLMVEAIINDLKGTPGIKNLKVDDVIGQDEIFIELDHEKISKVDLDLKTVGDTVRAAVAGIFASQVTHNNKDVYLKLQLRAKDRQDISNLKQIKILNKKGDLITLSKIAKFKRKRGTPQIKRYENKRSKTIVGNVDDTIITSQDANKLLLKAFEKNQNKIKGVKLYQGGAAESTAESVESLKQASMLAGIGILGLLVFMFNSYLMPLVVMSTIPLGLFGFSIAFFLHDRPISFLALIGIIGLAGIIVNSGIVLISYINQLRDEGKLSLDEILIKASSVRLRAVLVTSLTTISGLFPTAYGIGGSDAMLIPMTLAMAWGLTTGTLFTLIWVPAAYKIIEDITGFFAKLLRLKSS